MLTLPACRRAITLPARQGAPGQPESSLLSGLRCYWRLDETSGSRADVVGGMTLTESAASVGYGTGKVGNAALFDKTKYLSHTDNALLSFSSDFTLATWVKLDAGVTGIGYNCIGKGEARYGANPEYDLTFGSGTYPYFHCGGSERSHGAITKNVWHMIVAWYDSATGKIYIQVDNESVPPSINSNPPQDSTHAFMVGSTYGSTNFWGLIDETGLWGRVLSTAERADLWNSGAGKTHPF